MTVDQRHVMARAMLGLAALSKSSSPVVFKEGEHCLFDCAQLEAPVYDTPPDQFSYCAVGWSKGSIKPHMISKLETGSNGAVTESSVWNGINYDLIPPSSCTCGQPATKKVKVVGNKPNEAAYFACKCPSGEGCKPASGTTTNPAAGPNTCAACSTNQILNKDYVCQDCALGTVKNPNFNVCSPACGNEPARFQRCSQLLCICKMAPQDDIPSFTGARSASVRSIEQPRSGSQKSWGPTWSGSSATSPATKSAIPSRKT